MGLRARFRRDREVPNSPSGLPRGKLYSHTGRPLQKHLDPSFRMETLATASLWKPKTPHPRRGANAETPTTNP